MMVQPHGAPVVEDRREEVRVVRAEPVQSSKTEHSADLAGRLLVAGGCMAGAAYAGGALWGPLAAIATGALGFVLGLLLKDE